MFRPRHTLLYRTPTRRLLGLAAVSAIAAQPADAGIASAASQYEIVDAPSSVQREVYQSSDKIRVFVEREGYVAPQAIPINALTPMTYDAYADFNDTTLPAGTEVDSYFIHFDPVGSVQKIFGLGAITFDRPIIGVLARSLSMHQTDGWLGHPGTAYPTNRFNRELEYKTRGSYDLFTIKADQRTIELRAGASSDIDQIRILTAPALPGDLNLDNRVDNGDFGILAYNFAPGVADKSPEQGDLNDDQIVDNSDFGILAFNFGRSYDHTGPRSSPIPEPAGTALLGAAIGAISRRRRRVA